MAAGKRAPRRNPLIPVEPEQPGEVVPAGAAPICGRCWPGGWESLPPGADFASCEHGEWSTNGQRRDILGRLAGEPAVPAQPTIAAGMQFPGVTDDGTACTITWRGPGESALVEIKEETFGETQVKLLQQARTQFAATGEMPIIDMTPPAPVSPFKPQPAPAPVELDAADLDTGSDIMFMPSGG